MSESGLRDKSIPKVIWMLWFDGWDKAPELHRRCRESWQLFNQTWEVKAVSRDHLPNLLGPFFPGYTSLRLAMNVLEKFGGFWIPPAAESDLLRLLLLFLYGGVWADSTMLCRRPLDSWLPQVTSSGFFAFSPERKNVLTEDVVEEELPVMSSFLASSPLHPLVDAWLRTVVKHWSTAIAHREDLGFFWVHKLFGRMTSEEGSGDAVAIDCWAQSAKITGEYGKEGPHFFVPYKDTLRLPPSRALLRTVLSEWDTPMYKLTNHEVKLTDVGPESCYWILLEETRRVALRPTPLSEEVGEVFRHP